MNETNRIEILLVGDNQDDLDMTLRALRKANLGNRIQTVQKLGMYWLLLNHQP
jgi:hypothetical protein